MVLEDIIIITLILGLRYLICRIPRIAGGETVATFLATITFYLLKEQQAYDKLRDEIRSHFRSYEDICAVAAQQLPYLQAVIKEALRIHPPGSQGFPRVSPGVLVDGHWVPAGVGIAIFYFFFSPFPFSSEINPIQYRL